MPLTGCYCDLHSEITTRSWQACRWPEVIWTLQLCSISDRDRPNLWKPTLTCTYIDTHTHTHYLSLTLEALSTHFVSVALPQSGRAPRTSCAKHRASLPPGRSKCKKTPVMGRNVSCMEHANSFLAGTDEISVFPHPRISFPQDIWVRQSHIWTSAVKAWG